MGIEKQVVYDTHYVAISSQSAVGCPQCDNPYHFSYSKFQIATCLVGRYFPGFLDICLWQLGEAADFHSELLCTKLSILFVREYAVINIEQFQVFLSRLPNLLLKR